MESIRKLTLINSLRSRRLYFKGRREGFPGRTRAHERMTGEEKPPLFSRVLLALSVNTNRKKKKELASATPAR